MIAAAVACAVIALVVLAAIDDWRRRTVDGLRAEQRRRAARDRAWRALADEEPELEADVRRAPRRVA